MLLVAILAVESTGCDEPDPVPRPVSLKAVNIGFPPNVGGMGTFAVSPGGRVFVLMSTLTASRLSELEGSLEEDTQVWVRREQPVMMSRFLRGFVEGLGLIGAGIRDGRWAHLAITDQGTTQLPGLADGTQIQPLLVAENGAVIGVPEPEYGSTNSKLLRLAPGASAWVEIPGTDPSTRSGPAPASAVRHPNGKIYAMNGSRIFELAGDLSSATTLFDCDTRELGPCGESWLLVTGGLRLGGDGVLTFGKTNDEPELYSFRPGDSELTKRAVLRSPINEQGYFGRPQGLVVDSEGTAYVVMRTEELGGEGHVLAHRSGDALDEWVTVVTGLPSALQLQIDGKDGIWLWGHSSETYTGLWKLVPSSTECPRCAGGDGSR
ncbi:hypothetical protein ACN28E_09580 [Archangium lansingense]|uniref:hypothetical protein n=1 Tax=Archangium lansingense TaxID=2995310 RepID=UPI003B7D64FC